MSESEFHRRLTLLQRRAFQVGLLALLLCCVGLLGNRDQFFYSYLLGYLFWVGLALGSLGLLLLHQLVGGMWGFGIQRILESATRTIPFGLLLFIPILFGLDDLYLWADPRQVAGDKILEQKSIYLNPSFFLIRTACYFFIWMGMTYLLNKWSLDQDQRDDPRPTRLIQKISGPGLLLFVLTITFAAVDWLMSLEPHWFSSIFGLMVLTGQSLTALAFTIVVAALLSDLKPLTDLLSKDYFHDLGNLLLAFVMLWAYMAFSQFLIIWSANLPEEIPWYLKRMNGGWQWIGLFLILFHFAVPFILLLSQTTKRSAKMLLAVACLIVFMRWVDLFWLIAPVFHPQGFSLHWMDLMATLGIGGLWIGLFAWQLKGRSIVPLHDPRLKAKLQHAQGVS